MRIAVTGFSGEQPRVLPSLLPDPGAQEAWNVRLDDGGLTPVRKPRFETDVTPGHKTIYRHNGVWLSRADVVNFAPGPVAQDRLYFTGDGAPKMRVGGTDYPLAVPAPAGALTATAGGSGTGDVATRLYVYTWVTDFGEESEPCPISNEISWQSGITVTLSGFGAAPGGRNITKQRIYRSQTGSVGTFLYLIAERATSNADYVDTVPVDQFAEPLPSTNWNAPPDGLRGLVPLANGMMAAFVGRDIYFCEPWRPHAWPESYVQTVDFDVVALAAIDTDLFVMTKGQPYYVSGSHPSKMVAKRLPLNLPCINERAVVNLGFAVCYPTHEGLVSMTAGGGAQLVTANLFRKEDWAALSPQTAVAGQLGGRYVFFYDTFVNGRRSAGAFAIDLSGTAFLVRHDLQASACWYEITTSRLFFVEPNTGSVQEMHPTEGIPYILTWRSKEFIMPAPHNFGVLIVDSANKLTDADLAALEAERAAIIAALAAALPTSDLGAPVNAVAVNELPVAGDFYTPFIKPVGVDFEVIVIADGDVVGTIRTLDRPVRLPAGFMARVWEIGVRSNVSIKQFRLASTMADLMAA